MLFRFFQPWLSQFTLIGEKRLLKQNSPQEDQNRQRAEYIGDQIKNKEFEFGSTPEGKEKLKLSDFAKKRADELIASGEKDITKARLFALEVNTYLRNAKVTEKNAKDAPLSINEEIVSPRHMITLIRSAGWENQGLAEGRNQWDKEAADKMKLQTSLRELNKKMYGNGLAQLRNDFLDNRDEKSRGAFVRNLQGALPAGVELPANNSQFLNLLQETGWINDKQRLTLEGGKEGAPTDNLGRIESMIANKEELVPLIDAYIKNPREASAIVNRIREIARIALGANYYRDADFAKYLGQLDPTRDPNVDAMLRRLYNQARERARVDQVNKELMDRVKAGEYLDRFEAREDAQNAFAELKFRSLSRQRRAFEGANMISEYREMLASYGLDERGGVIDRELLDRRMRGRKNEPVISSGAKSDEYYAEQMKIAEAYGRGLRGNVSQMRIIDNIKAKDNLERQMDKEARQFRAGMRSDLPAQNQYQTIVNPEFMGPENDKSALIARLDAAEARLKLVAPPSALGIVKIARAFQNGTLNATWKQSGTDLKRNRLQEFASLIGYVERTIRLYDKVETRSIPKTSAPNEYVQPKTPNELPGLRSQLELNNDTAKTVQSIVKTSPGADMQEVQKEFQKLLTTIDTLQKRIAELEKGK